MQDKKISYWKFSDRCYQLAKPYRFKTRCRPTQVVSIPFVTLEPDGQCVLDTGFAFDGASGPVIQTKSILRCAAEHDAKYRLMREGLLDAKINQPIADSEFREGLIMDGVFSIRAETFYIAVHEFGKKSTSGGNPIEVAP